MSCELVYGEVTEVKPGWARVKFPKYDIVSDWLPIVKVRAMNSDINWPLVVNEQVACMMNVTEDDMGDTGVILGAINNDEDKPDSDAGEKKLRLKFADGASFEYDEEGHAIKMMMEDGGELSYKNGKYKVNNGGGETLHKILKETLEAIQALTVTTAMGPSGTPINISTFVSLGTRLETLMED